MTDTTLTDIFENPFDFDDPRIEVARVLSRAEAKAVLEFSGDILKALAAQPSAGAQPVARWECRTYGIDGQPGAWELSDGPADGQTLRPCRIIEYRPLYATAAQPDTGDVAALREAANRVVREHADWLAVSGLKGLDDPLSEAMTALDAALSKPNAQGGEG